MSTTTDVTVSDPARELIGRAPGGHWIGGERAAGQSGETFETIDPATGEAICSIAQGSAGDVDAAVGAARAAFEGGWATMPPHKRAGLIYELAEQIKRNLPELAELESLDNGKPIGYARGDVIASIAHLRYFAGWPTKIEGATIPTAQ